jgi:hypothetical protein
MPAVESNEFPCEAEFEHADGGYSSGGLGQKP